MRVLGKCAWPAPRLTADRVNKRVNTLGWRGVRSRQRAPPRSKRGVRATCASASGRSLDAATRLLLHKVKLRKQSE